MNETEIGAAAERIAAEIITAYESDSGVVMGIAWIHRCALRQLLSLAAQTAFARSHCELEAALKSLKGELTK